MTTKAIILGILLTSAFATLGRADDCQQFGRASVTLTGVLRHVVFPGWPEYEDIKAGDEPESRWVLDLRKGRHRGRCKGPQLRVRGDSDVRTDAVPAPGSLPRHAGRLVGRSGELEGVVGSGASAGSQSFRRAVSEELQKGGVVDRLAAGRGAGPPQGGGVLRGGGEVALQVHGHAAPPRPAGSSPDVRTPRSAPPLSPHPPAASRACRSLATV